MNQNKKIGITLRIVEAQAYKEPRDAISHDWIKFLEESGYVPVLLPNSLQDPVRYFVDQKCEALILSNGEDIKLKRKGDREFDGTKRDIVEAKLLSHAIEDNIPVLGVCRGMQFINVYLGGKLTKSVNGHVIKTHSVNLIDCYYQRIYDTKGMQTNSYHNMGILKADLANDLIPWALKDDVVEAFYHKNYPVVAIQWHPERETPSRDMDKKMMNTFFKRDFTKEAVV